MVRMSDPTISIECRRCAQPVQVDHAITEGVLVCSACGEEHEVRGGIVQIGHSNGSEDYPPELYSLIAKAEARHFWFRARASVILSVLRDQVGELHGRTLLDIGCGTGYLLAQFERVGMLTCGTDVHAQGLALARLHVSGTLVLHDELRVPLASAFDVVTLCDVIEHVEDDVGLIREASEKLGDGGTLVITVPAHEKLWSVVDEAYGHRRRYGRRSLGAAIQRAGLRVCAIRSFNVVTLPLQFLQRFRFAHSDVSTAMARQALLAASLQVPPRPLNEILALLSRAEAPIARLAIVPGGSLVAAAQMDYR